MTKFLFCLLLLLVLIHPCQSQKIAAGADAVCNFQTESYGAGVRATFFPKNTFSFSPQFTYYFPFNKITEYYLGVSGECKILGIDKFNLYALVHAGYNSWLNYESSAYKGAHLNNWNLEGGGGITTNKCLRPFLEYRYNLKFRETHLRLGLLYIFGCSGGKGGYSGKKDGHLCPAY